MVDPIIKNFLLDCKAHTFNSFFPLRVAGHIVSNGFDLEFEQQSDLIGLVWSLEFQFRVMRPYHVIDLSARFGAYTIIPRILNIIRSVH